MQKQQQNQQKRNIFPALFLFLTTFYLHLKCITRNNLYHFNSRIENMSLHIYLRSDIYGYYVHVQNAHKMKRFQFSSPSQLKYNVVVCFVLYIINI